MSLIDLLNFKEIFRRFILRCFSIEICQSFRTFFLFVFLSFFTTIIVNHFGTFLRSKSSTSISSLTSSTSSVSLRIPHHHQFLSSSANSLQQSQTIRIPSNQRSYTKDPSKRKNVSTGKRKTNEIEE